MFQWFHNLKIRYKLIGSFSLVTGLTIVLSVFTWLGQAKTEKAVDKLLNIDTQVTEISYHAQTAMLNARRYEKDYLIQYKKLGFSKANDEFLKPIQTEVDVIHLDMQKIRDLRPDDPNMIDSTQKVDQAIDEYHNTFTDVTGLIELQGYSNAGLEGEFSRKTQQLQGSTRALANDSLLIDVLQMRLYEKDYLHLRDAKFVDYLVNTGKKFSTDVDRTEMFDSDKQGLKTIMTQYQSLLEQVIALDRQVSDSTEVYQQAVEKLDPLLEDIRNNTEVSQFQTITAVQKALSNARKVIIILSIVVVVLGVSVAIVLSQTISNAVADVAKAATGIAAGNLNQSVKVDSTDELGEMASAFGRMIDYFQNLADTANKLAVGDFTVEVNPLSDDDALGLAFEKMVANLRQLVGQITGSASSLSQSAYGLSATSEEADEAAGQVASSVKQVGEGTAQQTHDISKTTLVVRQVAQAISGVADGAQEQAGAVNDSMMRVNQISDAVTQVSNNAQVGASQAMAASEVAEKGAKSVSDNIIGMESIKLKVAFSADKVREMGERSQEIGKIVGTINDIAAQTNLLALNAAIEAARAGEHGKGFAVVADEVRKLAEKSAMSTREISALIQNIQHTVADAILAMNDSAKEVDLGVSLAEEAGLALSSILEAVGGVQEQVSSIAAASEEMNAATSELVQSMESVSAVVEENTASTEEMAAGADELTDVIEGIASISEENSLAVQDVSEAAEVMSHQVEEVADAARSLNSLSNDMMLAVAKFKVSSGEEGIFQQLEVYRYDHMRRLDDLSMMLEGRKSFAENDVTDHTECSLGIWYYSEDADEYRNLAEFEVLDEKHHHFHDAISETISAYNADEFDEAHAAYQKVEALSLEMIAALSALSAKLGVS